MSSNPGLRRPLRGAPALLVAFVLALIAAGCATDIAPPATTQPTTTDSPAPTPTATPTSTPSPTPTRTPTATPRPTLTPVPTPTVVDGPDLAGVGVRHCPGTAAVGAQGSVGSEQSSNWSGYAITTGRSVVTCVESEWVQPKVKCHGSTHSSVSIWVGLGGFNQSRLEQIGTAIDCVSGFPLAYTWHESLPRERHEIDTPVPVDPGDRIWAQVRWLSGTTYQLSLANLSHPDGFTVKDTNKGLQRTEGEWIAEAPTSCSPSCHVLPMPSWGKITFDHIGVTIAGVRSTLKANASTRVRVRLVSRSGTARAVVTSTATDGGSFVVTWRHS